MLSVLMSALDPVTATLVNKPSRAFVALAER